MAYTHMVYDSDDGQIFKFKIGFLSGGKPLPTYYDTPYARPLGIASDAPPFIEYGEVFGTWTSPLNLKFAVVESQPFLEEIEVLSNVVAALAGGVGFLIETWCYAYYWADPADNAFRTEIENRQDSGSVVSEFIVNVPDQEEDWEYNDTLGYWFLTSGNMHLTKNPLQIPNCSAVVGSSDFSISDYFDEFESADDIPFQFLDIPAFHLTVLGRVRTCLWAVCSKVTSDFVWQSWQHFTFNGAGFFAYYGESCVLMYDAQFPGQYVRKDYADHSIIQAFPVFFQTVEELYPTGGNVVPPCALYPLIMSMLGTPSDVLNMIDPLANLIANGNLSLGNAVKLALVLDGEALTLDGEELTL